MIDYVIRPFAGLFLCLIFGVGLIYLPVAMTRARAWVQGIRGTQATRAEEPAAEDPATSEDAAA